jgi:hypothetical protein
MTDARDERAVRCTIHYPDGSATTADVTVAARPETWSPADAKAFLWAVPRLFEARTIYRISLVEHGLGDARRCGGA